MIKYRIIVEEDDRRVETTIEVKDYLKGGEWVLQDHLDNLANLLKPELILEEAQ